MRGDPVLHPRAARKFVLAFVICGAVCFIDVHFLAFYPLTIREPLSPGMSALVGLLGGLLAGLSTL
jgi:hypothetical protein